MEKRYRETSVKDDSLSGREGPKKGSQKGEGQRNDGDGGRGNQKEIGYKETGSGKSVERRQGFKK